jgi:hypothetical protein
MYYVFISFILFLNYLLMLEEIYERHFIFNISLII